MLATGVGEDDHAARALVNLATSTLTRRRDDPRVDADIERALRFAARARARRLRPVHARHPRQPARAARRVARGRGRRARVARARRAVRRQPVPGADRARAPAGAARRRRGGRRRSRRRGSGRSATRELQRLAPAAAARAEHAWLDGDLERTVAIARPAYELAALRGDAWARAELAFWLWRGGAPVEPQPDDPEPYARSHRRRLAAPRPRPGSASAARTTAPRRSARPTTRRRGWRRCALFDAFGAARAASHLRRRLRADGVRRIPRGPRAASTVRAGRADAARDRGARPDRARGHQRADRPGAGDHAQDGRPPRLGRAGEARRRPRGARPARPWSASAGLGARPDGDQVLLLEARRVGRAEVPLVAEGVQRGVELLRAALLASALARMPIVGP